MELIPEAGCHTPFRYKNVRLDNAYVASASCTSPEDQEWEFRRRDDAAINPGFDLSSPASASNRVLKVLICTA